MLLSKKPFAVAFAKHLLGENEQRNIESAVFNKVSIYIPSFLEFVFKHCSVDAFKTLPFFEKWKLAIQDIAHDHYVFDDNIPDTLRQFQVHAKKNMLPLASNTQGVEGRIKDITLRKSTGKCEQIVSNIGSLCSIIVTDVTKQTKCDQDWLERKKSTIDRIELFARLGL